MSDPAPAPLNLDDATFESVSYDQWVAVAEASLRGASISSLATPTYDGIERRALYVDEAAGITARESLPGQGDHVRGATAAGSLMGWDIRQAHDATHPQVNARILADLEGGATSILLVNAPNDVDALDAVLDGVYLDLAGIHLNGADASDALLALWDRRGTGAGAIGCLAVDPIGTLALTGQAPSHLDEALGAVAATATLTAGLPYVTATRVDGRPYGEAGASDATEIAAVLSTGVAYLRTLTASGLGIDDAVANLSFTLTVGPDQFLSIAKLRAARMCWARIVTVSGGTDAAMRIHATTAEWMLSARDPWVNMLRATTATFAAVVGGADAITVSPFDVAVGQPDELGLRIARNTHLLIGEEAGIGQVLDPAGGSFYVEALTDDLAAAAWSEFQQLEERGGIAAALLDGSLQVDIATTRRERETAIAHRSDALTGVSEFPNLGEAVLSRTPRPSATPSPDAAADTARLPKFRAAAPFEQLRDAADAHAAVTGSAPTVFAANLGPIATHTARNAFVTNLFAAGGIEMTTNDGFGSAANVAEAFAHTGLTCAVVCSSDAVYGDIGAEVASALKAAGARFVWLAGRPRSGIDELSAAGIDDYVVLGGDAVATLQHAHTVLEVKP